MNQKNKIDLKEKYLSVAKALEIVFESGVSEHDGELFSNELYEAQKENDMDHLLNVGFKILEYARAKQLISEFKVDEKILLTESLKDKITDGQKDIVNFNNYKKGTH